MIHLKKRVVVIAGQSNAIGWAKKDELKPELLDYGFLRTRFGMAQNGYNTPLIIE